MDIGELVEMDLTNCEINRWYEVQRTEFHDRMVKIRLAALGLNGKVRVIRRLHEGPVVVKVKGSSLTLGHDLAKMIILKEYKDV